MLDSLLKEIFYKQWSVNVNHAKDSSKDINAHMELESVETPHLRIRLPGIMKIAWQKPAKKPRNISTWVMCDKCERWFHLVCVGIIYSKEELEHMEWKCSDCGERKEEGAEEHHSPEVLKQHREERINPLLRFTRETVQVRRVSVLEKAQRETVQVPRVSLLVEAQRVQHTNLLNSSKLTFLQYPVQNGTPSRLSPLPTTQTTTQ